MHDGCASISSFLVSFLQLHRFVMLTWRLHRWELWWSLRTCLCLRHHRAMAGSRLLGQCLCHPCQSWTRRLQVPCSSADGTVQSTTASIFLFAYDRTNQTLNALGRCFHFSFSSALISQYSLWFLLCVLDLLMGVGCRYLIYALIKSVEF